jgi:hypothetical protein
MVGAPAAFQRICAGFPALQSCSRAFFINCAGWAPVAPSLNSDAAAGKNHNLEGTRRATPAAAPTAFAILRHSLEISPFFSCQTILGSEAVVHHILEDLAGPDFDQALWCAARECRQCNKKIGQEQEMWVCGGCVRVKYCSKECQGRDWGRHRKICRRLKQRQQEQKQEQEQQQKQGQ